jgi:hypothetical protein
MSSRSLGVLFGSVVLLLIVRWAPDIALCGTGYAFWVARRTPDGVSPGEAARAAMIGGCAARLLLAVALLFGLPLLGGAPDFDLFGTLFLRGAALTGLGILLLGTLSVVEAFLLGLAVRSLAPLLTR